MEHAISVGGAVRRPGAYPVGGQVSARDLSMVAEGLVTGASNLVLDINRAVQGAPERVQADPSGSMLAITQLQAGDDIRFNAQQPVFEGSAILLSGEVARPGLYAIRKGEKLSELLARAGGLTSYAYPYGTVFTRRSVKESQEEGFRRTARELNNSLLAIAARSTEKSSDGITGAAALIQTLAQAEAPGRMVVEADPRVLEIRPDLDTVLEPGDSIFVPKRPNFVLALGDVNNPGALQFVAGKPASGYLRDAGGMLSTADDDRVFMVLPNGTAQPVRTGGWGGGGGAVPPPGTTIIVPKNIDPLYRLSVFRDVTTIIAQLATSVATVAVLATR
jgi:protein involved in polysaccharide export with SLBB domain